MHNNVYVSGTNRRSRPFITPFTFSGMPAASEIRDAKLAVYASTGESVAVTLGEGGVVTARKYVPDPEKPQQLLLHLLHRAFGH
jgi:hypothetical protein